MFDVGDHGLAAPERHDDRELGLLAAADALTRLAALAGGTVAAAEAAPAGRRIAVKVSLDVLGALPGRVKWTIGRCEPRVLQTVSPLGGQPT
jgi:hypothetical protein